MTGRTAFGGAPSGAASSVEEIRRHIREIPDFPKPGISFKDITPLIEEGSAFHVAVDEMAHATEIARKRGKLPRKTVSADYELEYGSEVLEAPAD